MGLAAVPVPEATPRRWVTKSSQKPYRTVSFQNLEERNQILIRHLPQVYYIAGRIHDRLPHHVQLEDLVHSGVLGLMEALDKYDPSKKVQLKSYAKVRIRGAILDSLRELDWSPRTLRKKARLIERANHSLSMRFGRTPSESEIAAEMRMSLNKFQRLLGDLRGLELVSLQALGLDDTRGNEGSRRLSHSEAGDPSNLCLQAEMNGLLARAIGELTPRKRQVLALYYFEELTMKEVGTRLGVGESRVSQIHTASLVRLRARMRQLLESRVSAKLPGQQKARRAFCKGPERRMNPAAGAPGSSLNVEGPCGCGGSANLEFRFPRRWPAQRVTSLDHPCSRPPDCAKSSAQAPPDHPSSHSRWAGGELRGSSRQRSPKPILDPGRKPPSEAAGPAGPGHSLAGSPAPLRSAV